jgi:hypothetical protein
MVASLDLAANVDGYHWPAFWDRGDCLVGFVYFKESSITEESSTPDNTDCYGLDTIAAHAR